MKKLYALLLCFYVILCNTANAQINVTDNSVGTQLSQILAGTGVTISNVTLNCPGGASGTFKCTSCNLGIDSGIVLTTGSVDSIPGPNNLEYSGADNFGGGDQDLANEINTNVSELYDACVLEFDMKVLSDSVEFQYVFGSEEYPEWVCTDFNDVFGFFISGPGVPFQNIALIPGTNTRVSINSINSGTPGDNAFFQFCNGPGQSLAYSNYFINNGDGTTAPQNSSPFYIQYDGFTKVLTAKKGGLQPCATYHLKLAIADVSDGAYDSGVFLKANSLTSNIVTFDSVATSVPQIRNAVRGCVNGVFNLRFQKPVTHNTTIHYTIGGDAVNGTDYAHIADSITFHTGDSTAKVIVLPIGHSNNDTSYVKFFLYNSCDTLPYDSATLLILDSIIVTVSPDVTICLGDTVKLKATGSDTYTWTPGTGLSATTGDSVYAHPAVTTSYICSTVIGQCTARDTVTVTVGAATFSVNAGADISICGGGTAQLNAVVTGTPIPGHPFVYAWSPATGLSSTTILNPVSSTTVTQTYTIAVSSGNCSVSDAVNVNIGNMQSTISTVNETCYGYNNGSATINAIGSLPIHYIWSNSATTATASALTAGTYYVTATDNVGCSVTDTAVITSPPGIFFATPVITNVTCYGGNDGTITIDAAGGAGGITYNWSTGSNTNTATGLSAGTPYTLVVHDANNCSADTAVSITAPPAFLSNVTVVNITCFGNTDGSATAHPSGGTGPYTYLWDNNNEVTQGISNLPAGNYNVTTTDNVGCTTTAGATIIEPSQLTVTLAPVDVLCFGQSTGSITSNVNGGTAPYTYLWTDNNATTASRTALPAGAYSVMVTDSTHCPASASTSINQPATAVQFGTPVVVDELCNGGTTGSVTVSVSGGTPVYSYSWSHNAQLNSPSATALPVGDYIVTATDAHGCSISATNTVNEPTAITFGNATTTDVSCFNGTNGTAQVSPTGGTGAYTYTWNGAAGNNPNTTLAANTYNIVVTDANSCTATTTVTIAQPTVLTDSTISQNALCFAGANGSVTDIPAGGTPPYTYLWDDTNGQTTQKASLLVAGIYNVTVTDSKGCAATGTGSVGEPSQLIYGLSSTAVKCPDSKDGTISVSATGATPPYNYSATQDGSNFIYATNGVIEDLAAGLYTVLISDDNGCTHSDTITVPDPVADILTLKADSTSCFGAAYTDGAIHMEGLTNLNTPYQYSVDGSQQQYSGDFTNLAAGLHHVTYVNKNGCVTDSTIVVGEPAQGVAEILPGDSTIQLGETIQLLSSFSPYPTSSIISYNWSPILGLSCIDCPNPVVNSYNETNDYVLTIAYNNNCIATASARITVLGKPPVYIPNSFTPNGDGNNDVFLIYGEYIKTVSLKIFNRWGELVFESTSQMQGWDGNYKGTMQNTGVYIYEANVTFLNDKSTFKMGSIDLIR